jgi:branched-chain amino acid transport system substrate-binding protein
VPALAPPTPPPHAKIGVVFPQSGPNVAFGTDLKRGWDLWLQQQQGMLGQYVADVVPADEGTTPQAATAAVQKLLQTDKVDVVVGLVDNAAALAVIPLMVTAKKLLLVAGAGAADVTQKARTAYVWRTSYSDPQLAAPLGTQLAQSDARGGVYIVAPSDDQGTATVAGFQVAFESGGGRVAGTARLAPGAAPQRTITLIKAAKPKAVYCALAPADAVAFVKQYAQAGLGATIPLYGSGPLTEGSVLVQEGQAAAGVQSTLHYSDQLATPANTAFVAAYKAAYQVAPSCFSGARVRHRARAVAGARRRRQAARRRHALRPDGQGHQLRQPARQVEVRRAGARCRTSTCARSRTRAARWSTPSCSTSVWRASPTRLIHRD